MVVVVVVVGAVVTPDTVAVGTTNLIGTVYEIVTLSASRARKAKTEAGDLVLVDTV